MIFQNYIIPIKKSTIPDPISANLVPNLRVRNSLPKDLPRKGKKVENLVKCKDQEKQC